MSHKLMQAVNQVRLTNVAIVRLKRCGKRFEVACYKNKVMNWRNKVETNIDEVLQIDSVFRNVSKGVLAKNTDLVQAFGTDNQEECCKIILEKGDLQVSDLERELLYENLFRDIATIVTNKCINPLTKRPYPVGTIETAMKETLHYAVKPSKTAKQQALDVIKKLQQHIPLKRADMLLRLSAALHVSKDLQKKLKEMKLQVQKVEVVEDKGSSVKLKVFTVLAAPGYLRELDETVKGLQYGSVQVQDFSVQESKDTDVEDTKGSYDLNDKSHSKEAKKLGREEESVKGSPTDEAQTKKKKKKRKGRRRQTNSAATTQTTNTSISGANDSIETAELNSSMKELEIEKSKRSEAAPLSQEDDSETKPNPTSGLKCGTCSVFFGTDRSLQRQHYKTDLHRINLKLKSKNSPVLSQEDFDLMDLEEREQIMFDFRT
mmetsp:Transcript_1751/g.2478  ORF Transcript_1751/g.2478 Transcript_1751/m.2478 type:complete len:432 (-) Transcript_1751:371-1666(-)